MPERWPLYGALHRVTDWSALCELLMAIREAHAKHDEQERQARAERS